MCTFSKFYFCFLITIVMSWYFSPSNCTGKRALHTGRTRYPMVEWRRSQQSPRPSKAEKWLEFPTKEAKQSRRALASISYPPTWDTDRYSLQLCDRRCRRWNKWRQMLVPKLGKGVQKGGKERLSEGWARCRTANLDRASKMNTTCYHADLLGPCSTSKSHDCNCCIAYGSTPNSFGCTICTWGISGRPTGTQNTKTRRAPLFGSSYSNAKLFDIWSRLQFHSAHTSLCHPALFNPFELHGCNRCEDTRLGVDFRWSFSKVDIFAILGTLLGARTLSPFPLSRSPRSRYT